MLQVTHSTWHMPLDAYCLSWQVHTGIVQIWNQNWMLQPHPFLFKTHASAILLAKCTKEHFNVVQATSENSACRCAAWNPAKRGLSALCQRWNLATSAASVGQHSGAVIVRPPAASRALSTGGVRQCADPATALSVRATTPTVTRLQENVTARWTLLCTLFLLLTHCSFNCMIL